MRRLLFISCIVFCMLFVTGCDTAVSNRDPDTLEYGDSAGDFTFVGSLKDFDMLADSTGQIKAERSVSLVDPVSHRYIGNGIIAGWEYTVGFMKSGITYDDPPKRVDGKLKISDAEALRLRVNKQDVHNTAVYMWRSEYEAYEKVDCTLKENTHVVNDIDVYTSYYFEIPFLKAGTYVVIYYDGDGSVLKPNPEALPVDATSAQVFNQGLSSLNPGNYYFDYSDDCIMTIEGRKNGYTVVDNVNLQEGTWTTIRRGGGLESDLKNKDPNEHTKDMPLGTIKANWLDYSNSDYIKIYITQGSVTAYKSEYIITSDPAETEESAKDAK